MFGFIWRLPWFIYIILAVAVIPVGFFLQMETREMNAKMEIALQGPAPKAINANEVTANSFTDVREITVKAQVDLNEIYTVSISGRRVIDREKTVIFAFAPDNSEKTQPISVVFMLDTEMNVQDFVKKNATGETGALSPIVSVNGQKYSFPSKMEESIQKAASQSNLNLAPNVQYVAPFPNGREEALKATSESSVLGFAGIVALILAAYGGIRYFFTRQKNQEA